MVESPILLDSAAVDDVEVSEADLQKNKVRRMSALEKQYIKRFNTAFDGITSIDHMIASRVIWCPPVFRRVIKQTMNHEIKLVIDIMIIRFTSLLSVFFHTLPESLDDSCIAYIIHVENNMTAENINVLITTET